ncbi:uncharacterized protein [Procambarus clarkii]|uniref:uncharacterized protein n=1 Tax=Procambarus clarkii TaxID=6728 RepID=UPI00374336D0
MLSSTAAAGVVLRQVSWCVTVVVVSDDLTFLATFAQWSLKGRLLVWSTRLLVVTRLPLHHLQQVLSNNYTFLMMNAMLLVLNNVLRHPSFSVHVWLPYSAGGARAVRAAVWAPAHGLQVINHPLFPHKFNNFYGATVNVSALPYRPYWSVEECHGCDGTSRYSGSDAMLLMTIAQALNFTFSVLPVTSWDQVTGLVMERISFMATVYHVVLPQRRLLYDFTYTYEHILTDFAMAKPSLISNWQSLYSCLADKVWASILAALLVVPPFMVMGSSASAQYPYYSQDVLVIWSDTLSKATPIDYHQLETSLRVADLKFDQVRSTIQSYLNILNAAETDPDEIDQTLEEIYQYEDETQDKLNVLSNIVNQHKSNVTWPEVDDGHGKGISMGDAVEVTVGALLGQSSGKRLPGSSSSRVLLVTWLLFAFVVGTVYRGTLTAALTLPKYPPRIETLQQLVGVVHKVTMPPYGEEFLQFFKQSDSIVFQTLSRLMELVPSAEYGLRQAVEKRQAHMDGRRYLQQMLADHFMSVDGSTKLYIGRQSVLPGLGAWPIPHDAPYKPQLDTIMMSVVEAGLYEKWVRDELERTKQESRRRQLARQESGGEDAAALGEPDTTGTQALALHHMQGPFMLLALGLVSSLVIFVSELLFKLFNRITV